MTDLAADHKALASYRPTHKVRFVTAASLFDGHDASINIMRRILQGMGAEVIHLGHNRSVDEVVTAALQEDAQGIAVSSYQNATVSSGRVQITHDVQQDITGRNIIIVEDILDSGSTLAFLKDYLLTKGAASITIVTLLDKPSRRTKAITPDFTGFTVPDEFVVGYGLDFAQKYRNMPYIGVLKPEVYAK